MQLFGWLKTIGRCCWLVFDSILNQCSRAKYVALKVTVASNVAIRSEVNTLTELCPDPNTLSDPRLPVPKLFDSFDIEGPNGVHNVLALEPLGRTLQQFIAEMQWRLGTNREQHDIRILRNLSRRMIYAVHYIHSKRTVHRGPKYCPPQRFSCV